MVCAKEYYVYHHRPAMHMEGYVLATIIGLQCNEEALSLCLYIPEKLAQHEDLENLVTLRCMLQCHTFEVFHQVIVFFIVDF